MSSKRIAFVTGASAGLGREFARQIPRFFPEIDQIWLVARRQAALEETAAQVPRPTRVLSLDLEAPNSWARLEEELRAEGARCQLWVNNAGFGLYGAFADLPLDRQLAMIDLNVRALTALSHLALKYVERGGALVNVASLAAYLPLADFAVYAATKAYVRSFSVALAAEVESRGILVHTLLPGPVKTEFAVVASQGAVASMGWGQDPAVTVRRCLRAVRRRRWWSHPSLSWKLTAWLSRWLSWKAAARLSRKFLTRPQPSSHTGA